MRISDWSSDVCSSDLMPSPKREAKAAMVDRSDPLWFKDAIVYQLHVKAFFDSTNDGIGDIGGLIQKLDYAREIGVTAIWLLPFYPSPLRDVRPANILRRWGRR